MWFIPYNRHNLSKVLSGGIVAPHKSYLNYRPDAQCFSDNSILLIRGGVSEEMLGKEEFSGQSNFLVLLEIDIKKLNQKLIISAAEGKKLGLSDSLGSDNQEAIVMYSGSIPSSEIKVVHFRTKEDLEDFETRSHADVPYDVIKFAATKELFNQNNSPNFFADVKRFNQKGNDINCYKIYKEADSHLGALVLLTLAIPAKSEWFEFCKNAITQNADHTLANIKKLGESYSNIEQHLFKVAYLLMVDIDGDKEWNAKNFLEDLDSKLDKSLLDEFDIRLYEVWYKKCLDILDTRAEAFPLRDDGDKALRAILLVLLRGKPDDVISAKKSSLHAGPDVTALALILVGAKMGFQRIDSQIKARREKAYSLFSIIKSKFFNAAIDKISPPDLNPLKVQVKNKEFGLFGTSMSLIVDNYVLAENQSEGPQPLLKILAESQTIPDGIHFEVDRANNRLKHKFSLKDGRFQTIYLSVVDVNLQGESIIRVSSPCLNLSTIKGKLSIEAIDKHLQSNYKTSYVEVADKLLMNQGRASFLCYSIDIKHKYIYVLRDYPLSSSRFEISLLEYVANSADNTERFFHPAGPDQY